MGITSFANSVSRYFTPALFIIATGSLLYWSFTDIHRGIDAFTAVLIVACPCALALSSPFTLGNAMRILGRSKLYLKDTLTVEKLGQIDHIVLDKTGTITKAENRETLYVGEPLCHMNMNFIASVAKQSTHPLSRQLYNYLNVAGSMAVKDFEEIPGKGLSGKIGNVMIKIGSAQHVGAIATQFSSSIDTKVWVSLNSVVLGCYTFSNAYRDNLSDVIGSLKGHYKLSVLSGDNEGEAHKLATFFGAETEMCFKQSPQNKLDYIKACQDRGEKLLMIGDGLNDAGALRQSDAGIAVSEDINNFSPACDAILDASSFSKLPALLSYSRSTRLVLFLGLAISGCYNLVGLFFAVQGHLSPVIAAILMPLSSFTIIVYGTLATQWLAYRNGLAEQPIAQSKEQEDTIINTNMQVHLT